MRAIARGTQDRADCRPDPARLLETSRLGGGLAATFTAATGLRGRARHHGIGDHLRIPGVRFLVVSSVSDSICKSACLAPPPAASTISSQVDRRVLIIDHLFHRVDNVGLRLHRCQGVVRLIL